MNFSDARNYFPYLRTPKIYFNHAAMSPLSTPVVEAVQRYLYERSESEVENFPSFQRVFVDTRSRLAALINAPADRIAFSDNTSNAINILAQGLTWKAGDRILLNDIEFPTNVYPFMNLKQQGVEIDFVKSVDGTVPFESIESAITEKTRLLSISHVQFLSGYRSDLKKIGELCKSRGVIFCVDDIQASGALLTDVKECKIDYLACGCHKWMMGLEGLSFLYLTEELQDMIHPRYVGWLSVDDDWNLLDYKLEFKKGAARFQNGTMPVAGVFGLNASLKFFAEFDNIEKEKRIIDNTEYFISLLSEKGLNPVMQGVPRGHLSGIVSCRPNGAEQIFERLMKNDVVAALREGVLRFSPHFYNTKDEINAVVEML